MMRVGRCLRDLIPVVLNRAIPEPTGQRLIGGARRTTCNPQRLDLIECVTVPLAGQCRGRTGTKHLRLRQRKRPDVRPVRELRLFGEVRRGGLIVSWIVSKCVRNRRGTGTIVTAKCEQASGDRLSDANALGLVGAA